MKLARWTIAVLITFLVAGIALLAATADHTPDPCQEFRAAFRDYVSYNGHPSREASDRYWHALANRPAGCTANGR